ncbi:MAG: mechanosensitive ion channel family protein [Myxococcales bacterium]|nr:mechanosensitive ion channel family protein [Myxococcales bacterium]
MQEFLTQYEDFFASYRILGCARIVLASLVAAWLAEVVICRSLAAAARKTETDLDDRLIATLRRPIFLSVLFYGLSWSLNPLDLPLRALWAVHGVLKTIIVFIWAGVGFNVASLFLEALTGRSETSSILQQRTLPLFSMLLKGLTFGMAVYFLFLAWDIDVTAWLASAGIIGLAVGFAAQDTLSNLFAGIFIIADAPYKIDDYIVLDDGTRGRVTRIGIRSTRVLTLDDVEITIPNSVIGGSKIINEAGGPSLKQRVAVAVDAAYGVDIDEVRPVLLGCIKGISGICTSPAPATRFRAFGASGLAFELLVWIADPSQRDIILDVLHERVYRAFNEANLEIPFSKHDLYLKETPASADSGNDT